MLRVCITIRRSIARSTPRRGAPALIGGIQAAVNGAPHLGTRDAWWPEGWTGHNGWIIEAGTGEPAAREAAEARAIYQLLENRIVPAFYDRERGGVPQHWLPIVKAAIVSAVPRLCARRMMKAFADGLYRHPAVERAADGAGWAARTRNQDV